MRALKASVLAIGLMSTFSICAQQNESFNARQTENSSSLDSQGKTSLTTEEKALAKQWMLKESDWVKYKELMSGPRGVWSPGLDPLTALGVSETDPQERARYAMIWMKVESRRMELELAFEVERQKAAKELFGDMPVVNNKPWIEKWHSDRNRIAQNVAMFVEDDCLDECEGLFQEVRDSVSRSTRLDVFFAPGATAATIGEWAHFMKIHPDTVSSRKITLNFESGKASEYGVDLAVLPSVKVLDVSTGSIRDYDEQPR